MRILSITHMLGAGGLERAVQNCALEYRRRGHESAVLSFEAGGARVGPIRAGGVAVFLPEGGFETAVEQARDWRPDVIHIHRTGITQPIWGRILRRLGEGRERLPVVETNHFARPDYSEDRLAINVHIQLSKWCLWKWRNWTRHMRPQPIGVVVPHMVLPEEFYRESDSMRSAFRLEHGIPHEAVVFGRIGQPDPGKWLPMLFDAFAEVAERNSKAWLLLAGLPEALRPRLELLPADIRSRVRDVGLLRGDDALRRCYSAMDVFVHASMLGESFGFVLCESMLCETPVITLNRPLKDNSQLEVVGHQRGGLVVCGVPSMVTAMESLGRDAGLRTTLGAQGRRWVLEQYGCQRIGDSLIRVLQATIEARDDPTRLAAMLADLAPDVGACEIRRLARNCLGRTSAREMLLLPVLSNPLVFRGWSALKYRKRT